VANEFGKTYLTVARETVALERKDLRGEDS
jgi:hypothetical protein